MIVSMRRTMAAIFALVVLAPVHLALAQKEPRDAEILMRAALAAKQPRAAAPAIDWFLTNKYQDPQIAALAAQLTTPGATR